MNRKIAGLAICIGLAVVGEWLSIRLSIPLPGGVIGFFILLAGLAILPALGANIEQGADLLLDNLVLLFIPAVMSIIAHQEFFGILGLKLLIILVAGTAVMMASIGLLAQWMLRRRTIK